MNSYHNYEKAKFLSFFKSSELPKDKINERCLQHRELLFNEQPTKPELLITPQEKNLTKFYVPKTISENDDPEDRLKLGKSISDNNGFKQYDNTPTNFSKTPKDNKKVWKRGGVDNKDRADSFKDNNEVNKEFNRQRLDSSKSNTQDQPHKKSEDRVEYTPEIVKYVENFIGDDCDEKSNNTNLNNNCNPYSQFPINMNQSPQSPMQGFPPNFGNPQQCFQPNMNSPPMNSPPMNNMNNPMFINFVPVNSDCILQVCQNIKYSLDDPLWYIFHPMANSTFGPLNSKHIIDMCNMKMINGLTDVRLIDIFNVKNYKPFTFFKLKDIEREGFSEQIEDSQNLKFTFLFSENEKNKELKEVLSNKQLENDKLVEQLASLQLETNLLKEINKMNTNNDLKNKEKLPFTTSEQVSNVSNNQQNQSQSSSNHQNKQNNHKNINKTHNQENNQANQNDESDLTKATHNQQNQQQSSNNQQSTNKQTVPNPTNQSQTNQSSTNTNQSSTNTNQNQTQIQSNPTASISRAFVDNDDEEEETNNQFTNSNNQKKTKNFQPESDEWEVKSKKKRPGKAPQQKTDQTFSLSSLKTPTNTQKEKEKEKERIKFSNKIDLVKGNDLVEMLKPAKQLVTEEDEEPTNNGFINTNTNSNTFTQNRSKKAKGRPVELNVKLGFGQHENSEDTFKVVGAKKKK